MLKNIVNRKVVTTGPLAKVSEVAKIMAAEDVGCVLILDDDRVKGLVTDRDLVLRCLAKDIDVDDCTVENVMSESLATVKDTDGIFDCIKLMKQEKVRRIPVLDDGGKLVGIVSFGDLLAVLSEELEFLVAGTTSHVVDADFRKGSEAA